ncbi:MAG: RDD family protein [Phycisphaerales bacterium]|nr:RDD family protein [Phycisphaerales bacterium]
MIRWFRWLAATMVLASMPVQAEVSTSNILPAAGAGEHIWFLLPSENPIGQWDLCHVGRRPGSVSYRAVRRLAQRPVAMAAWGNTLWLVMASNHAREDTWDVYQLRAKYQAALDMDLMEPQDGLGPLPPLAGLDVIDAMAGTSIGPVVIGTSNGERAGMQLTSGQWGEVELPAGLPAADASRAHVTGCCGPGGLALVIDDAGSIMSWTRGVDGTWLEAAPPITGRALDLVSVDGHPLLALSSTEGAIELAYIQGQFTSLAEFSEPEGEWAVVGLTGNALVLVARGGEVLADQVDALTGILEPIELVQPKGLIASSIWSIAVAVGLASMVIMIIVLARGGDLATGTLPQGCAPMQPMVRLAALCIDLVPGLLVFFLATEGTLRELVRVPMMSMNADDIVPYAWLVLVTVCWCGIWELASGTSMGKGICGGRVRSTTGNELKARQVLVRNFVKALILLVPPLAILTLLHPNQQGLGDLMARTVVVRPLAPPPAS